MPKYTKHLKEIHKQWQADEDAYTSDLDVDLTAESEVNVENMKSNYKVLVPDHHKYHK